MDKAIKKDLQKLILQLLTVQRWYKSLQMRTSLMAACVTDKPDWERMEGIDEVRREVTY